MSTWKRPENLPFPNVWARFEGRIPIDGKPLKYRIQDVTDDLEEPVVDHMCRYFLIRENLTSHDGFVEEEESFKEVRELWTETVRHKMTLVALVDDDDDDDGNSKKRIAGCNVLSVSQKDEPKPKFSGKGMNRLMRCLNDLYDRENIYEKYGVDKYMTAYGLSVAPQYQGDSISYHLLKARDPLCQATGLKLALTLFSSPAAIHSAVKAGYTIAQDYKTEDYKIDGKIFYPRIKTRIVVGVKLIPNS